MVQSRRGLHLAVALGLLANLALIAAWPLLHESRVGSATAPVYAALCHQLPGRCYQVSGVPLPVCARCLGVWLGLFLAATLAGLACLPGSARRARVVAGLLGWMLLSWLLGHRVLPESWHLERTVAGLAGGLGLYLLVGLLWRRLATLPAWLKRPGRLTRRIHRRGRGERRGRRGRKRTTDNTDDTDKKKSRAESLCLLSLLPLSVFSV